MKKNKIYTLPQVHMLANRSVFNCQILLGILFIRCQLSIINSWFQRVYDILFTSVFERVGVLRELLCVRYGYQTLLSENEMDFTVEFLCLQ